ncbi:translational GTPase TypA [Spiroplasma chrysopicola]|uniref:Large ribosomal subunit assembly factor BipA n=1 Tax=Spiroplasma chrysopicola DF-1 TaxID=1276227 RepID=R4UG19_9MOLU|nr:translational GTPase TypA [Spiroplasma chrysopicola]AGM25090.1 GTP-binding protein [Spiroplasma chrysopicola DF-1]
MEHKKIINIAVIAHVDAGKSTLVDALLQQSGVFHENAQIVDLIMDSDALEKERGITIYAKNCAINYRNYKINIVDTPGHADFSSEIERIIKTVDTVILLVDSSEGPMPQTRFVLQKSLELGLRPILLINKIDKKDQRAAEVVNEALELFMNLGATDEQLDFPVLYGIAKQGIVQKELTDQGENLIPLFETIINHVTPYPDLTSEPLRMQVSSLAFDEYIGRLGIGRLFAGTISDGQEVAIVKNDGQLAKGKITGVFIYEGLKRIKKETAVAGDIVIIAGISDISIGDTICDKNNVVAMEPITIEEPTLAMNFLVNKSPFAGKEGKFVTTRNIKERLEKELEVNVGLRVQPLSESSVDGFRVSGRGELHLSILLENLRREGFELAVSKPEVLLRRDDSNVLLEPMEEVIITVPDEYSGTVIGKLNLRKGTMLNMDMVGTHTKITYSIPTRGLIGYQREFINATHGEGILVRKFSGYEQYKGEIPSRGNGVLIANEFGITAAYALGALEERGSLFVNPGTKVYEGMIVGIHSRSNDLVVNPCKNKKLTNTRSAGNDDAIRLSPPIIMNLEESLEFIENDELVEITPLSIRLRKKWLNASERKQYEKQEQTPVE